VCMVIALSIELCEEICGIDLCVTRRVVILCSLSSVLSRVG
jgi:hypothetical protein